MYNESAKISTEILEQKIAAAHKVNSHFKEIANTEWANKLPAVTTVNGFNDGVDITLIFSDIEGLSVFTDTVPNIIPVHLIRGGAEGTQFKPDWFNNLDEQFKKQYPDAYGTDQHACVKTYLASATASHNNAAIFYSEFDGHKIKWIIELSDKQWSSEREARANHISYAGGYVSYY